MIRLCGLMICLGDAILFAMCSFSMIFLALAAMVSPDWAEPKHRKLRARLDL